jgi:hypothetical protein
MTTKPNPAPQVVLRRPHTALGTLLLAKAIHDALAASAGMFPSPVPTVVTFGVDIAALDVAQTATQTKTKGTVQTRDAKLAVVITDLNHLRAYVQTVVDADPTNAATIAHDAGMGLRKPFARSKNDVSAKPNKTVSGSVDVMAKLSQKHESHEWQYSTDGGKSWTSVASTLRATTTISGFTPGTAVMVRHRAITKTGPDAWSQAVSLIAV